jgi:RNA polymerase sigma-70 factor (ECF subfamily)
VQVVTEGLLKWTSATATDREAVFESLLRTHEQMVLRVAYRMLGSRDDAEDAAQEVFLRLHRHFERIDLAGAVQSWLYKTTMNVCYDQIRRRRPSEPIEIEVPQPASQLSGLLGDERRQLLADALLRLPERERAAVVLREIEGLETREVAEVLGVGEVTVRSQISSARGKLKAWMEARTR